ncbi:MAG: PAS domain S-box protein [Candidatus Hydrogenedentes bacterium]|nr:PAS domain S-box protein [Candidatus Hydrogenedentota bacterium]
MPEEAMDACAQLLRSSADRVIDAALDRGALQLFGPSLHEVVEQIANHIHSGGALDVHGLRACTTDDSVISRTLHLLQAEIIELFRRARLSHPYGDCVLGLRKCVRNSIPRASFATEDVAFFEQLMETKPSSVTGDSRLLAFTRGLMSALNDMLYVHDLAGNFLYINQFGLNLTKFTAEDLQKGLSLYELVVPDYLDLVEARMQSPRSASRSPFTIEIYTKDGERLPVEILPRGLLAEGPVAAILGVARDVRLEHRLEEAIRRSNLHLESIISAAPIGIITTDAQGRISEANAMATELCGVSGTKGLIGVPLHTICKHPESDLPGKLRAVLEKGIALHERCAMTSRFGTAVDCDVIAVPLRSRPDTVDGLLVMLFDATEELEIQQALLQSEKLTALGEVIAGVAHEMNNPLTGILGYAQFLLLTCSEPEYKSRLEHIAQEAQRCRHVVQSLLTFAQRQRFEKSSQDVNRILEDTVALQRFELEADQIKLAVNFDRTLPSIQANAQHLQKVFLSLINNAHQALSTVTERERRLEISTYRKGACVCARVKDNGPGIPREFQSKIFFPFFTTQNLGGGTGLGLSVSFGIVRDHGGHILVDSTEGSGAALTVVLPIVQEKVPSDSGNR